MYEAFMDSSLGAPTLSRNLRGVQRSLNDLITAQHEREADDLLEHLKDLEEASSSLQDLVTGERRNPSRSVVPASASDTVHLRAVLREASIIIEQCDIRVVALQSSLDDIAHERDSASYTTQESLLKNQTWYDDTMQALKLRAEVLRILFSAISVMAYKHESDDDGNLSPEARSRASTLHYQITLVEPKIHDAGAYTVQGLRSAVSTAKAITFQVPSSANKHFMIKGSVKSFYTGRTEPMAKLRAAFEDATHSGQKRFVIFGLSGSGKTQLTLKYADEQQDKYWGIFFIDGSSRKNASASYAEIATIGGVEPNERAAKNWLVTRDLPWLLIVDNVDSDEVSLDDLLTAGNKGCVLITSRNPANRTYGNVGVRHLELQIMEEDEANELILKAAEEPSPWSKSLVDSASMICQALGYLPLALVHAAKAILDRSCAWSEYLPLLRRQTRQIRRDWVRERSRSPSKASRRSKEDDGSMAVFSTYEILYRSLAASHERECQDAIELLHVFSYFHFQNIRLDILINAAINPFREADQKQKDSENEQALHKKLARPPRKTWSTWLRELSLVLGTYSDTPPPLPTALKNANAAGQKEFEDEVHIRLSEAVAVLTQRSLIMRHTGAAGRFSMHRLVHQWIRDRPETRVAQQLLWCQIATTVLAKSIVRPPLGDTAVERSMRRELLPHIDHARGCQRLVEDTLKENQVIVKPFWPVPKGMPGKLQAEQSGRFSRVYSECGFFSEALQLQSQLRDFLVERLGESHPFTIQVTLFTSGTLWELTRMAEATQLLRGARLMCEQTLGEDHPLTLQVSELLGSVLYMKGRWAEALAIHQANAQRMGSLYGEGHEQTLKSIRNAGRIRYRLFEYRRATELHQIAWEGMKKRLGETHLETLGCLEDLAMSYHRYEAEPSERATDGQLLESHVRMKFVLEERKKQLGKENPYTLLATLFLAMLKSELGQFDEAERMIREGLSIAARNLGDKHSAVLAARSAYSRLLIQMDRCNEAEKILREIIPKQLYQEFTDEDGDHPDRIGAMWWLVGCLEKQGRPAEALAVAEEVVQALESIGGHGKGSEHKFAKIASKTVSQLRDRLKTIPTQTETSYSQPVEAIPRFRFVKAQTH